MLGASLLPEACDKATSLTRAGSIFVRSISAFRMTAPSSPAPIDDRLPPNLPTGVRIGATMAARRRVISGLRLLSVKIGRAHVCTPVTNAHLVCRLLLEKKKQEHTTCNKQ